MGGLMRVHDWPERLNAAIEAVRDRPFEWGRHDCCLFAADIVLAMTGCDHAADYRGTYKTAHGAKRALIKRGYASIEQALDELFVRVDCRLAQRGDLVVTESDGLAVGIHLGSGLAFVSEKGLEFLPVSEALIAWRVE